MKRRPSIKGIGILLFLVLLTALPCMYGCGGGGGGGGGAAVSGITYTGITTQASVNMTNGVDIAERAYNGGEIGSDLGGLGAVQELKTGRPRYIEIVKAVKEAVIQVDVQAPPEAVGMGAIVSESDTIPGSCGGTASYSIQVNTITGEFSGSMNFNNYCSEGTTVSGSAQFSGAVNPAATEEKTHFSLTFSSLTATSGADSITLAGSISCTFTSSTSFTADIEGYEQDNISEKVYWVNNYVLTCTVYSDYIQFEVSGRFYNPDYGYVELSTPTPFRIYSGNDAPSQGVMIVSGQNNTKARLTANSDAATFVVDVDANGDDTYEWTSGNVNW